MSDFWSKPRSLYDVADDVVSQLGDGTDDADSGTVSNLEPIAAKNNQAPPATNPPHVNAFFDQNYDRISRLAKDMNVPPNLLLGLSAYESGWGRNKNNNLFGSSIDEAPIQYPTLDDSVDAFRKSQWFDRLSGKSDPDSFVGTMLGGQSNTYNSKNSKYGSELRSVIDTVDHRLPIWEATK
jgi:hypothetical protein